MYEKNCLECDKEFSTKYVEVKFCSPKCSAIYNKRIGIGEGKCTECGNIFVKQSLNHVFCSKLCKERHHRGNNKIEIECSFCGNTFTTNKKDSLRYENHFCTRRCESKFRIRESLDIRVCENCGFDFECKKHDNLRFCSIKCQGEWQSRTRVGKNSPTYKHEITENMRVKKCEFCGKEMVGTPKAFENKKYCSVGCRIRNMNKTLTNPHVLIINILNKNKIHHDIEHSIKRFSIDCMLNKHLAIEIMGTYWHCDPRFYKNEVDDIQKHSSISDKNKKKFLSSINIKVLYLWEYDIINDVKLCEKLILKFVKSNGTLKNYHSMNYSIYGNGIKLNDKILVPKFEK